MAIFFGHCRTGNYDNVLHSGFFSVNFPLSHYNTIYLFIATNRSFFGLETMNTLTTRKWGSKIDKGS